jgi:hypothetical protein
MPVETERKPFMRTKRGSKWAESLLEMMVDDTSSKPHKSGLLLFVLMPGLLECVEESDHVAKAILNMCVS